MKRLSVISALLLLLPLLFAAPASARRSSNARADSLNLVAQGWFPVNLDSAQYYAESASYLSGRHSQSRYVAANTLGDIAFARMNYVEASYCYESVLKRSRSRVEWLKAYVGMMNICQRISDNMSFYQYRDKALLELRGIKDEFELLSPVERNSVALAETDLRIISATYFSVVEQSGQARQELSRIEPASIQQIDTLRFLRINMLAGNGRMRYLSDIYLTAIRNGYVCQSAIALQGMASTLMALPADDASPLSPRITAAINPTGLPRDLLIEQLLLSALRQFLQYGSMYGATETYCLLGQHANECGNFAGAIEWLEKALDVINTSRDVAMSGIGNLPYLESCRADTVVVENAWVEQVPWIAVPECMSRIREQLSIAFSGLGDMAASFYNRNVYLELQKTIRLDRRYEARQHLLRRMNRSLVIALAGVVLSIVLLALLFVPLIRAVDKRNIRYKKVSERLMSLCGNILTARPEDGQTMSACLTRLIDSELIPLIGAGNTVIEQDGDSVRLVWQGSHLRADSQMLIDTVTPFVSASIQSAGVIEDIGERQIIAGKEHHLALRHAAGNKRQNIIRRACCSVMSDCMPLIDRMVGEASRLKAGDDSFAHHLEYIAELAERTGQYNALLTQWIRMCQGEVSLHIENFALQPLLNIISHSSRSFQQKGIRLQVDQTDCIVKADRALTLFMLNTLVDNARKFTPQGGSVSVQVQSSQEWVELSVSDTGVGLSDSDIHKLLNEKVYDPQSIGQQDAGHSKGGGFGLMNCRGIIEKYHKSGPPFDCCSLSITSQPGQGSRFSFRLPKGIRRSLQIIILLLLPSGLRAQNDNALLDAAYAFADSLYECNVRGEHSLALQYADMALGCLNDDYSAFTGDTVCLAGLLSSAAPAEQTWLAQGFGTDYQTILWIRNEVAVAALDSYDMELYKYNNDAYLTLFRLFYSEKVLERDCQQLQRSNSNVRIAILLIIVAILLIAILRLVLYSRYWLRYRSDTRQIMKLTGSISSLLSDAVSRGNYNLQQLTDNLAGIIWPELRLMMNVESLTLCIISDDGRFTSTRGNTDTPSGTEVTIPMTLLRDDSQTEVGNMTVRLRDGGDDNDRMACHTIARYLAVSVHNCMLRLSSGYRSLEQMREESERLALEDNRLHVQNMVLDNCLSTLRHETLSYPSRIELLAGQMLRGEGNSAENIRYLNELVLYYREIYDILSRNASRQLGSATFKVESVSVSDQFAAIRQKYATRLPEGISLSVASDAPVCRGDSVLLLLLLENLVEQALSYPSSGALSLYADSDGDFVRIVFEDSRTDIPQQNLGMMFTPLWQQDNLRYATCRQIIRQIDESMDHPGCRINAEPDRGGGVTIWLTLPTQSQNQ